MSINEDIYNDSMNNLKIENAFEDWAEYRRDITDVIINNSESDKTVAIFGAGRCNDIDIYRLSKHFGKIYLVDFDTQAMADALKKYHLENDEKIIMMNKDFLGLSKEDYLEYMKIATTDLKRQGPLFSPFATAPKMVKELDKLYAKVKKYQLDLGNSTYDYSITIGVHTQLNVMPEHLWRNFLMATGKNDKKVAERAHAENEFIARRFDDAILKATKNKAFIGLESCEIGISGFLEGAIQAREDLYRRSEEKEIAINGKKAFYWPFNLKTGKEYMMEVYIVDINKKLEM